MERNTATAIRPRLIRIATSPSTYSVPNLRGAEVDRSAPQTRGPLWQTIDAMQSSSR